MRTLLLALALSALVQAADSREVNKSARLNENGSVTINNHKGSIEVSTWDRPEVEMRARIEAEPGMFSSSRRLFDATEVQFDASSNSVQIRTKYPDMNGCC